MKKLLTLVFFTAIYAHYSFAQCTSCHNTISSNNSGSQSVGKNKTLCFTGGTYTGSISSVASNGTICVASGATFSPSSLNNFSGTINVYGTANLPAFNSSAGAKINNYGTVNFTGGINFNGTTTITNSSNGTMIFASSISMNSNSSIVNDGLVRFSGDLSVPSGNTFTNNNVARFANNISTSGTFTNSGLLVAVNTFTVGGGTFVNNCRLVALSFTNTGNSTTNRGLIWAAGSNSTVQLNGGIFNQTSNGEVRGVNFSNAGSVTGSGKYYFSGTTTNSNIFGNDGGGINFYDISVNGGGSKIFDNQNTNPHSSVFRTVFTPSDTTGTAPTNCSSTYCTQVTADAGPDQSRCNGSSTFTLGANTASGATGLWTLVSGNATIASPTSPTSNVTVNVGNTAVLRWTLSNYCSSNSDDVTISNGASPSASITGTNTICSGQSSTFTASGGNTYAWSNGATTASINVSTAGTYSVTVTNAAGCTATASRTLTVNSVPTASISGTNAICGGASSTFTASGGGTYAWSTGATTAAITVSTAGTYTVTVTNAAGCSATASRVLAISPAINISPTSTNSTCGLCNDGTISLSVTGGTSPLSYSWNDGSTAQNRTALAPGNYSVTVRDANSCTATASVTIYLPLAVNVASLSACNLVNGGAAQANTTGGKAPYRYVWNTGETSQTISNLVSGNYTVTVTDDLGATATQTVTISNTMVNIAFSPAAPVICRGNSVQVTASGALSYNWSPGTGLSASNIANPISSPTTTTTYTVSTVASTNDLVTNGNFELGNTGFTSAYGYVSPAANAAAGGKGLYPEGRYAVDVSAGAYHNNFTGFGNGGSGKFMIINGAVTAGQAVWSQTILVQPNTTYNFSTFISSVNEANPANLRFQINGVVLGPNIVASTTRGRWSKFTATWNSGSNTSAEIAIINDNTIAGGNDFGLDDISFTSTCISSSQVTVTVNQPPTVGFTKNDITCNGLTNGSATVAGSGTVSPYTYIWSTGSSNATISNLAVGTYNVTVRDGRTCTNVGSVAITQPAVLSVNAAAINVSCFGAANGSISLSVSGGTPPYTYSWSNGSTTQNIASLAPGNYSVTVRDANNCSATTSATISQPSAALVSTLNVTNVTCNGGTNGAIGQIVSGGTSPYTYLWSTGATTQNISGRSAGNYSVTITDNRGCTLVKNAEITQPPATTIANAGPDLGNCNSLIFTMAANTPVVGNGSWSVVNGIAVITAPTSPTSLVTIVGTSATLRWTISNGSCPSNSDDVVLTNTVATVTANAGSDITRVNGSTTFTMAANNPGTGSSGLWTLVRGTATIASPTSRTSNVTVLVGNEAMLEWKVTNGFCVARDTILIKHLYPYSGCVAINSGEWNQSTTWAGNCTGGNGYPGINDTAIITGKTVTVSGNSACKLLQMSNELGTALLNIQTAGQLTVAQDIQMNANAQNTVKIDLAGNGKLFLGGTIKRNAAPMNFGKVTSSTNSTITFNGTTQQQILPTSRGRGNDGIEYQNVVFNNTSGIKPAFIAEGRVDVLNTIALQSGCIDMGRDTIMLSNNNNNSLAGGSDSSYVMGQFCRYIGQSGKTYRWSVGRKGQEGEYWFELKNNLLVGTSYVCVEFDSVPDDSKSGISYTDNDLNVQNLSPEGIWRVEPNAQPLLGSYDVNVSTRNFSGLVDERFGLLKRPTGSSVSNWGKGGGLLPIVGNPLRLVSSLTTSLNSLTSFSEFGIGNGGGSSLPVKLTVFEAKPIENKFIRLKWVTETEIDNMGFEIHRSVDGLEFNNIGWVNGNGNTTETKVYNYDDKTIDPNIRYYYRLKQIDFDGDSEFSPIASAEIRNSGGVLEIGEFTPNPAKNNTAINITTDSDMDAQFIFIDMMGKVAKKGLVSFTKGSHLYYFDINELATGNYIVAITTHGSQHSKKLIVY